MRERHPRVVAPAGLLDLDHLGAEVGQEKGAVRSRQEPGEVEDPDTRERAAHAADSSGLLAGRLEPPSTKKAVPVTNDASMKPQGARSGSPAGAGPSASPASPYEVGFRNGVWQAPQVWRPNSFIKASVASASFDLAGVAELLGPGLEVLGCGLELGPLLPDLGLGVRLVGQRARGEERRDVHARSARASRRSRRWPRCCRPWPCPAMSFQLAPFELHQPLAIGDHVTGADLRLGRWPARPATSAARPPTHETRRQSYGSTRMSPPLFGSGPLGRDPAVRFAPHFGHLVADRRNGLQVAGDGQPIGLGQVLVAGRRALDDLAHEARPPRRRRACCPSRGSRRSAPRTSVEAGVPVRRDVGHRRALRALAGFPRQEAGVVDRWSGPGACGTRRSGRSRARGTRPRATPEVGADWRRRLARREGGQPGRQEHALEHRHVIFLAGVGRLTGGTVRR